MIIAIDGPAAAGKGTLAKRLAKHFNFSYLDTGALYRAVALTMLRAKHNPSDIALAAQVSAHLDLDILSDPDLRREETGQAASQVAAIPEVRANLLNFQRQFASRPPEDKAGAVLDGRDIGTVVCPTAAVKIFVTASAEERAKRRFHEQKERVGHADYDEILADVVSRDDRDMNRSDAPLKPAENAHLLDTTKLDIDAVFDVAVKLVQSAQ
ncbi:(d)CMP kinase [Temperatibacter marinus]|uniref:Cytidylate kinase n=1 Tax=Temperatibacter marinus TaxID=1456591 RepID=A0AA52ED95_9PROT|nr:(d)CMP kinase [Temperatibacter marinus]WND03332.1 (d)CMP kinase [Temperatibacter marinus]